MNSPAPPSLSAKVLDVFRRILGPGPVALHEPEFSGNEWSYVKDCLESTYVSSVGKYVDQFEVDLATYTGAKHAVALMNGTSALHIALLLAGVRPGDEVLIPALTFVGTANAVAYCGATPHFVDSESRTFGMDSDKLCRYLHATTEIRGKECINVNSGRPIRALVPVHVFGHPVELDKLATVAAEFGLVLIEDAAESLGSTFRGRHTGTFGRIGVLSFNGNKTVTCGGGGAILTDDPKLAQRAKHLSTTAKLSHPWRYIHDETGFNYRMPNLNAALGCAQLERLPMMLAAKRKLYHRYAKAFTDVANLEVVREPPDSISNYWLQALILDKNHAKHRDEILEATNRSGYMTRPVWDLLCFLDPYRHCPTMDLSCAKTLSRCLISIPSSAFLAGFDHG